MHAPLARPIPLAIAAGGALLVVFGIVALAPREGPAAAPPNPPPAAGGGFTPTKEEWAGLETAPVVERVFRPEVVAEGNIALDDALTTPVFSPYSGRVVRLIAELGARLEKGAPLLAVEATEIVQANNDLVAATATLATARSQLNLAQMTERRQHALYLSNGAALKDWQQSQADLVTAQSNLRSGEIALAAVRNRLRILGKSEAEIAALEAAPAPRINPVAIVTAPIAGTVTQRQVGLGQNIQSVQAGATNPVYTIADLSTVYLIANVREADAGAVHVGAPVEVRVLAYPGQVFRARLSWVAPSIDPNTHRLPVRADVENSSGGLKPMMFATFAIVTGTARRAPAVPPGAIVYEGDQARVWVAGKDGTLALRRIRPGQTRDGMVEVPSGLAAGERVVTRGTIFIDRAGGTG
jgi:cobalt-zinc-cadmium efflux system membrane fusion protein